MLVIAILVMMVLLLQKVKTWLDGLHFAWHKRFKRLLWEGVQLLGASKPSYKTSSPTLAILMKFSLCTFSVKQILWRMQSVARGHTLNVYKFGLMKLCVLGRLTPLVGVLL